MCRGPDGVVIRLQSLQRRLLQRAGEEQALQRVKFLGHVVLAMEIILVKDLGKYFLSEDMLDQHLTNVFSRNSGIDRFLRVLEKFGSALAESRIILLRLFDHLSQSF